MSLAELETKEIPDEDFLFMRVHKNLVNAEGLLMPVVFKNHGDGMSTDWAQYSTPLQTKNRVVNYGKDPMHYGVINLPVVNVRAIENQQVIHSPMEENYSHTDVMGEKTTEVRLKFLRIFKWELPMQ